MQDFLALEFFTPAILLDDHVWNFVNALVGGESPAALQALSTAANQIAGARLSRINYLVIQMRTERALHRGLSLGPTARSASASS
jgi:hypothetical protein